MSQNDQSEIEAITRFKNKMPKDFPLEIKKILLQDAVSHIRQKKALLLILHNCQDSFSMRFFSLAYDRKINSILEEYFVIIAWDMESHDLDPLVRAIETFPNLRKLSVLISDRIGAAVCLLPEEDDFSLLFSLKGEINYEAAVEKLEFVRDYCLTRGSTQENIYTEIECIKSLRKKLPTDISVHLRHCNLDDAINFICTSPLEQRKALLIYLHNSNNAFSQMFSQNLGDGELATILNKKFIVLGWDIENIRFHDALVSALSRHSILTSVSDLVTNKVAVGICILPINGNLNIFMCLRDKITLKNTLKNLKRAATAFDSVIEQEKELHRIEQERSHQHDLGSEKLMSIWADMLGDRDYDSFEFDQHELLKNKIGFALKGPPKEETGYEKGDLKQINELYEVLKTQSSKIAQYKDRIEVSFIYVCLEPLPEIKIKKAKEYPDYNPQIDVNPVPVFVLRKCRNCSNPCRVFIDHTGRVYQNWHNFLSENKFEKCEMIVPLDGRFQVVDGKVLLEKHLSPVCQLDAKLLQVGDITSTVAGLASGGVFVVAAFGIAAPPVLIGAAVVGAGAGLWAIGRSIHTLVDRSIHDESLSFANSEARGAYLNIVAGSLGFAGAGANMALSQLVARGAQVGKGATYFVNTIQVLNLGASGAGLANSGYEIIDQWINDKQPPTGLAILQLTSSILFFGHAIYSFKGAQTIVDETQAKVLKDYQDSLRSNRHRRTFNNLMKDSIKNHGDSVKGKAEVISAIRNIKNRDEVFAALTKNKKAMTKAGIRFSADGGNILLGDFVVDMDRFVGLNKKQAETFLSNLAYESPKQSSATASGSTGVQNIGNLKTAVNNLLNDIKVDMSQINISQVMKVTCNLLIFCSDDIQQKVVEAVHMATQYIFAKFFSRVVNLIDEIIPKNEQFFKFLQLGISFFSQEVDKLEEKYQLYHKTGAKEYYNPIFESINPLYAKRIVAFFEFVVRNSYSGSSLTAAVLKEISGFIAAWITRAIFENEEKQVVKRRRELHSAGFRPTIKKCVVCGGSYYHN